MVRLPSAASGLRAAAAWSRVLPPPVGGVVLFRVGPTANTAIALVDGIGLLLRLREQLLDDPAEGLHRLSPPDRHALDRVARLRLSRHEAGRALDAGGRAVCETSLHPCPGPAG